MRMSSMQMVSKLDMPLQLYLCLGTCSWLCWAIPLSSKPRLNLSSLHFYSREWVKVKTNTTCKSSISVSLQTHPFLSSNKVAILGVMVPETPPATHLPQVVAVFPNSIVKGKSVRTISKSSVIQFSLARILIENKKAFTRKIV